MASLSLAFEILAKDAGASRTFDKVGDSAERSGKRIDNAGTASGRAGKALGGGLKLGALAAVAGIGGLTVALGGFIRDAAESARIGRLTDAVLKSTGGAAKISASQLDTLVTSISNKTAVDDEAIQSGANLLLTFTKVRNEVGAGNDIFNQATQAAVDLSAGLGVDLAGANIQLGKALNDPIKGITALSRAGVSFTAQQKEQIKVLVAAGDTLGAQKIILGELTKQFGGAAKAAADPLARLQVVAGNLGEKVGGFLLPSVERFATFISDTALPKVERFFEEFRTGTGTGGELRVEVDKLTRAFRDNEPAIQSIASSLLLVSRFITTNVVPTLGFLGRTFGVLSGIIRDSTNDFLGLVRGFLTGLGAIFRSLSSLPGPFKDTFRAAAAETDKARVQVGAFQIALNRIGKTVAKPKVELVGSEAVIGKLAVLETKLRNAGSSAKVFQVGGLTSGDGPGAAPGGGGSMLNRVSKLIAGTGASVSSTYRTPARNRAIGGSPTSYHLDRNNPAVDVVGPNAVLNRLQAQLRAGGGLRELLWQVPGHYDHLHAADRGGVFRGPGLVRMGAGEETFASGLRPARKVAELPAVLDGGGRSGPTINYNGPVTVVDPERFARDQVNRMRDALAVGGLS